MIHEVEISNLMFNKTSDEQKNFKKYDINIDLQEESSDNERIILKYSLDLTSNPKNALINITGNATLRGGKSEIEKFLEQSEEKTPEAVSLIYQELFPLIYIISKNMKIPSPSHTISQNVIEESEDKNEKFESDNEKSLESANESDEEVNNIHESVNQSQEPEINKNDELDITEKKNNENES